MNSPPIVQLSGWGVTCVYKYKINSNVKKANKRRAKNCRVRKFFCNNDKQRGHKQNCTNGIRHKFLLRRTTSSTSNLNTFRQRYISAKILIKSRKGAQKQTTTLISTSTMLGERYIFKLMTIDDWKLFIAFVCWALMFLGKPLFRTKLANMYILPHSPV